MGGIAMNRGTLRQHSGRYGGGPPFLVCALFIGLTIISISYYSLSSQYTQLEQRLGELLKQQGIQQTQLQTLQADQLSAQMAAKKARRELDDSRQQLTAGAKELDSVKASSARLKEQLTSKSAELSAADRRITELTDSESRLRRRLKEEESKAKAAQEASGKPKADRPEAEAADRPLAKEQPKTDEQSAQIRKPVDKVVSLLNAKPESDRAKQRPASPLETNKLDKSL